MLCFKEVIYIPHCQSLIPCNSVKVIKADCQVLKTHLHVNTSDTKTQNEIDDKTSSPLRPNNG